MTFARLRLTRFTIALATALAVTLAAPLMATGHASAAPSPLQVPIVTPGLQMIAGHPAWRMSPPSIDPTLPPAARRAHSSSSCVNNACPIPVTPPTYHGGLLVTQPRVYVLVFSDTKTGISPATGFQSDPTSTATPSVASFIGAVLNSSYSSWWSEYSVPASGQILQPGSFAGQITVYDPTLADATSITDAQIAAEMISANAAHELPAYNPDNIFTIMLRAGQIVSTSATANSTTGFCAYHEVAYTYTHTYTTNESIPYIVLPNEAGNAGCPGPTSPALPFDQLTTVFAHELMEAITDPFLNGWGSPNAELSDVCDVYQLSTYDTIGGASYAVQYNYSVAGNDCVDTLAPITMTYSTATPTSVLSVSVSSGGAPLAGETVSLVNPVSPASFAVAITYIPPAPTSVIASAVTDATGVAVLHLPGVTRLSTLLLYVAGTATTSGAFMGFGGPGAPVDWVAPIAPAATGVRQVYLGAPSVTTVVGVTPSALLTRTPWASFRTNNLTIPAEALPVATVVALYPVAPGVRLARKLPRGHYPEVAVAVAWRTARGTAPTAHHPLRLTLPDLLITRGCRVYEVTATGVRLLARANASGSVTVSVTVPGTVVVTLPYADLAELDWVQAPPSVTPTSIAVGQPVTLVPSGGSGTGAYTVASTGGGTATGCRLVGLVLSATGPGTCLVTVERAASGHYGAVIESFVIQVTTAP